MAVRKRYNKHAPPPYTAHVSYHVKMSPGAIKRWRQGSKERQEGREEHYSGAFHWLRFRTQELFFYGPGFEHQGTVMLKTKRLSLKLLNTIVGNEVEYYAKCPFVVAEGPCGSNQSKLAEVGCAKVNKYS